MLHKDHAIPGAKLRVNDVIKDGLPSYGMPKQNSIKETLYLSNPNFIGMFGGGWDVRSGAILEVVKKPRKVHGINVCLVNVLNEDGSVQVTGEAYWCELRASTTIIME